MRTLYLAGPIMGCSDKEAMGWRADVKQSLAGLYEFRDPMDRDYRGKETGNVQAIIHGDLADILASDAVLVNAERASWGTAMELVYARTLGKPAYIIHAWHDVSPWLLYHSAARFATVEDAVLWFREMAGGHTKRKPLRVAPSAAPQTE